jgi:hypothetical protein
MLKTVNRVLLGLTGLGLLALGGGVLIGALDLPRHWGFELPGWWPFRGPHDVVLGEEGRTRYRNEAWWWPTVLAVLTVLLVLLLLWLLTQLRRRHLGEVRVESGAGGETAVRGRALEDVLAAEAVTMEGVSRANVVLTGRRRTTAKTQVGLALEPYVAPVEALRWLSQVLGHARDSVGLERLPAEARIRGIRRGARRVA